MFLTHILGKPTHSPATVLQNEVMVEEEPFSQNYRDFIGRGPFAAALFAQAGKRPAMCTGTQVPNALISDCWQADASKRPSMDAIVARLRERTFVIPNAC